MSKNTSVESSTQTFPSQTINPVIQAALGSLDVELEEELARYRRQRAGRPVMSPRSLGRHQTRKPIELISVNQGRGQTQLPALGMSTAAPIAFPLFMANQTPPEPASSKETTQQHLDRTAQLDAPSSETALPLASRRNGTDNSASKENVTQQLTPPEKSTDVGGGLVPLEADQAQPEDYLESSEQLLRSLEEQEGNPESQKHFADRLLTPLGVGSILLLLLSIPTLAYIFTNPSTLNALNFGRFFGSKTQTMAQKSPETKQQKHDAAKDSPIANGPNLASEEFVDLNLNTLSHLEANATPSSSQPPASGPADSPNPGTTSTPPNVVPNSELPKRSTDLASVLLPSSIQQGAVQSRVPQVAPLPALRAVAPPVRNSSQASVAQQLSSALAKPAAEKLSSAPAMTAAKKPSPTQAKAATKNPGESSSAGRGEASSAKGRDDFYYVLLNGGGERTLQKAKTVAPDAYVRNLPQGDRIQVAAFKRESEAKTMVTQLQQQGFSASIYHP